MILSDYLEKKLLDLMFANTSYAPPATLYFGLFTADPGESGIVGEFTIGSGAYARAVVTNNTTNFPPCSVIGSPVKANGAIIAFPTATAAWGTATHWAIFDAATTGTNMLAHGALNSPRSVAIGDTPKIALGACSITIVNASTGGLTYYAKRKLLDHVFGGVTYSQAATIYTGLGTATGDDSISEWMDTNYTRQSTAFTAATSGVGTCPTTATQTYAGVGAAAGAVLTSYGIWDASSSGNLLAFGPVNSSRTVAAADTVTLAAAAAIVITFA